MRQLAESQELSASPEANGECRPCNVLSYGFGGLSMALINGSGTQIMQPFEDSKVKNFKEYSIGSTAMMYTQRGLPIARQRMSCPGTRGPQMSGESGSNKGFGGEKKSKPIEVKLHECKTLNNLLCRLPSVER